MKQSTTEYLKVIGCFQESCQATTGCGLGPTSGSRVPALNVVPKNDSTNDRTSKSPLEEKVLGVIPLVLLYLVAFSSKDNNLSNAGKYQKNRKCLHQEMLQQKHCKPTISGRFKNLEFVLANLPLAGCSRMD
jgi:hypothetical protein